ncbi:Uu.00g140230.m01.CDS01 [Anthostomella pinea]|uniref:Uu.00g140230.m01.CDS01 n=1 Tax=Anthostomella pinea TaxID=933095 RepID=A0AAI8VR83_9PEZI|nr:Uu.00g140230.m01.CDS01 [Anthostomella pinea]
MRASKQRRAFATIWTWATTAIAQTDSSSKRGMSYISDNHNADYDILLSCKSPIDWYYTWSPSPAPSDIFSDGAESSMEFVPALPGIDNLDNDIQALNNLPDSSKHLFTFNEPDGTTSSGGSSISPGDAAKAYIEQVVPLRHRFQISHPAVTGSPRGLEWLSNFNSSCWDIDEKNGCPTDFVTAHWYGNFAGLASWIGQLEGWYNQSASGLNGDLKIWLNEFGLVQADEDATFAMMNQTLPYLDSLGYVEKYASFGVFREDEANDWTGAGLSLFQNDGGLTELGAYYLGGESNGFEAGNKGQSSGSGANDNGNDGGDDTGGDGGDDDANAAAVTRINILRDGERSHAAALYAYAAMVKGLSKVQLWAADSLRLTGWLTPGIEGPGLADVSLAAGRRYLKLGYGWDCFEKEELRPLAEWYERFKSLDWWVALEEREGVHLREMMLGKGSQEV